MKIKHIEYPNVDYSVLTDRERQLKACRELYAIFCLTNNRGITDTEIGEIAQEMGMTGYAGITLDRIVSANLVRWHKVVREVCGPQAVRWCRKEKRPGESKGKYYLHPDFASQIPNLSEAKIPQTLPIRTHSRSKSEGDIPKSPQIVPRTSTPPPPMVGLMIDEPKSVEEEQADVIIETTFTEEVMVEPFDESWYNELLTDNLFDMKTEPNSVAYVEQSDSDLDFPDDDDDCEENTFPDAFADLQHQIMMDELRGTTFPILQSVQ